MVVQRLRTDPDQGLSEAEVAERRRSYGRNELPVTPPRPWWVILQEQFRSLVIALLAAAAVVAWWVGEPLDALAITAVLVINATFGFVTELRARQAIQSLSALEAPDAVVVRDGKRRTVEAGLLVPGDIVAIEEGEAVPADLRLLESRGLQVMEAALTGESVPTVKRHDEELEPGLPLSERVTVLHQGTVVVSGSGLGVVTQTGEASEVGRIGLMLREVQDEATPLEVRLDQLGRKLIVLTLAVTVLVVVIGVLRGAPWALMIETGLALAVAAVPEGLPAVATVALAVGLRRMALRNALVRRLPSVETLGSVTVICTDKTGTLTTGHMQVVRAEGLTSAFDVAWEGGTARLEPGVAPDALPEANPSGAMDPDSSRQLIELEAILEVSTVVNRSRCEGSGPTEEILGDPTDVALWKWAQALGRRPSSKRDRMVVEREIPFTSERMLAAALAAEPAAEPRWYVKGAPERVLDRCDRVLADGREIELDDDARATLLGRNERLAEQGLRVLGCAVGDGSSSVAGGLTFVGLVGLLDPPAPGVEATARVFADAGIRTLVITGDQLPTARAVARSAGLVPSERSLAIDGAQLSEHDDRELQGLLEEAVVLARVAPADKLRVVDALRRSGQVVAMLGDGVNDAAALKRADVGVAMGKRGADVAKEAADMILLDDRFATVGAAIEEGRVIFENIRKFIYYLFSCNLAEVLVILVAGVAGWPTPLLPLQILWLNLVTDTVPALALALEPAEVGIMSRRPRPPGSAILERREIFSLLGFAWLIALVTLAAFVIGLPSGAAHASTLAFFTLAFAQILHLGNARGVGAVLSPTRMLASRWALIAVVAAGSLQLLALGVGGLAAALRLTVPSSSEWLVIGGLASIPAVLGQLWKVFRTPSDRL